MFKYLVLITCLSIPAWAKRPPLELHVQEPLTVYERADERSKKLSKLQRGDVVLISYKRYGRFRKVLVTYRGKRRGGYIVANKIQRSYTEEKGLQRRRKSRVYQGSRAAGGSFAFSAHQQPERDITGDDDVDRTFGEMQGSTSFLKIFNDFPMSPGWDFRAYLSFRETDFAGTGTTVGTTSNYDVRVKQNFISVGGVLKHYRDKKSIFWYGVGGELGYGSDAEVTIDEFPVESGGALESFIIVASLHTGWDFQITDNIFFLPELAAETVLNADPFIYGVQIIANVGYRF